MAGATLDVRITASENASGTFEKVGQSAQRAGEAMERAGQAGAQGIATFESKIKGLESSINTVGSALTVFGGAVTAAFGFAAQASIGLESAMANVNSIAGLTDSQLASTTDQVRALAVELGKSPTELAEGLYDIQSSGFAGADAMNVLRASTVAAGAGLTDVATAGKAITAVLNAYGLSADKAGDVSDLLFKAVDSGVITFEQLARNMGSVLAPAAALRVPLEQITAAFAELTLQGIGVSQAETGIAAFMRSALAPTEAMTEAIEEYGFASAEALIQSEGLVGFLDFLQEASGGSSSALQELLGSTESTTTALALLRNEGDNYTAMLGEMTGAMQDGATTQGVFAIQAETTGFALQRLSASFENAQIAAGNALGPFIEFGANALSGMLDGFASLPGPLQTAVSLLGAAGGVATLAGGAFLLAIPKIVAFREAMVAIGGARGVLALMSGGFASLGALVNPLTIGLVGLGAAAYGLYKIFQNVQESASGVAEGVGLLTEEIERLKLAAQPDAAQQVQTLVDSIQAQIDLLGGDTLNEIVANLEAAGHAMGEVDELADIQGLRNDIEDAGAAMDEFSKHVIATANSLTDPRARQAYLDWVNDLFASIEHTAEGSNLDEIIETVLITPASEVPGVMAAIEDSANGAAGGIDNLADSITALSGDIYGQIAAAEASNRQYAAMLENVNRTEDAMQEWLGNGQNILDFWLQYQTNVGEARAENDAITESMEKGAATWQDWMAGADPAFVRLVELADNLSDAGRELDAVLATFGRIDALGQRSAQATSIADALIGPPGELGTIQELWDRIVAGTSDASLTAREYNNAIAAGVDIQESNLRIQDDLNTMRAQQLPLLAQEQAAYEAQIEAISLLPPLEQRRALAMQDSAVQVQIASQYATAYSASLGEIPEEVATNMIVSAAEADPVLKDLLLQFGLIEEGADGTITVNFPDGPTVQESISELTASIDRLIIVMGGIPPLRIDGDAKGALNAIALTEGELAQLNGQSATTYQRGDNSDALGKISSALSALRNLDGASATVSIYANNFASGAIAAANAALNALDGRVATSTIQTVYTSRGVGPTRQLGGALEHFDMGGMVPFWAGEGNRPEVAHFAQGGTALIPHEGLWAAPAMTYISPSNNVGPVSNAYGGDTIHVALNIAGNVIADDDYTAQVGAAVVSAMAEARSRQLVARGVA